MEPINDRKSIFVYASNSQGIHGAGSALAAKQQHGAVNGVTRFCRNSYGISTKHTPYQRMTLDEIKVEVDEFIQFANRNPEYEYTVVRVGCGLAGYSDSDIAPMFYDLAGRKNVQFDPAWEHIFRQIASYQEIDPRCYLNEDGEMPTW